MSPVARSTSTSTAVQLNSKNAAVPPSGCSGSASLRISPSPMISPPSRPSPRISTSRMGKTRSPIRTSPRSTVDRRLVDAFEPRRHRRGASPGRRGSAAGRVAHQHRRAARRGLLVVRDDRGVAHDHRHPVERRAQLLGRDLGEDRPGALAHVGRPGVDDDAPVGEQADGRIRQAGRRPGLEPDRDAAATTGRRRAPPPDHLGRPLDGPGPVAVGRACRPG